MPDHAYISQWVNLFIQWTALQKQIFYPFHFQIMQPGTLNFSIKTHCPNVTQDIPQHLGGIATYTHTLHSCIS